MINRITNARDNLVRSFLKEKKGMSDENIAYFLKEFDNLTEIEKSEVIYEMVGKEIYKECPVDAMTFISDPFFLGNVYDNVFKIWKDMLVEIYPAPFCKKYNQVVLSCATRCFGKGTEILMHDGSTKKVEDVVVGDKVMGPDGSPRNVLSLARGREQMYKITPARGGNPFVCNASHKLALKYVRERKGRKNYGKYSDIEVKDYLVLPESERKHWRMYHSGPIEYTKKDFPIDPYIFGTWIGDGDSYRMRLSTVDEELVSAWKDYYETLDESYNFNVSDQGKEGRLLYSVTINKGKTRASKSDPIKLYIKGIYETYGHKRIPFEYLTSSIEDRQQLLAGILDTDGYKDSRETRNCYRNITTKYSDLAEDYATLARSLGFRATVKERHKKLSYKDEIYTSYDVNITGDFSTIPMRLERKKSNGAKPVRDYSITEFKVEPLGEDEYFGFEVDVDHKFLLPDYLVTCNSGKTYISTFIIVYEIYLLTCMINPIKTYSVSNIVFGLLSKDNSTAVSQLGAEVYKCLTQAPYFKGIIREKLSFSKVDKDGVQITDDILIKAGSSVSTIIGTNLYVGCIDEANAPSPRIAAEHLVETRMKMYQEMRDRREASFSKAPKNTGMLMFTSSPTDEGDVLSEIIADVEKNNIPGVLIRDNISRWEAREEDMDETVDFFLGSDTKDPCILDGSIELKESEWERVISFPAKPDYIAQFQSDPYLAIQNIAGRRTMPETSLFNTVAAFEKVFCKENHIFSKDTPEIAVGSALTLDDYLINPNYFSKPDRPDCFRYIHLDMAYRCDRFGMASVYSDKIKFTSEDGHEIYRRMYFVDFCLGVTAKNKEAVDILKVLEFVYSLKERGYPLKLVTTDNHQGEIARQMMAKKGVRTEYLSVEKSKEQYLNLKNTILTGALEGFKNPALMRELRGLRESSKKIEKGKGYTDDMSDSLAGALWSCSQDKFFKKNNEAISEIIKQTGKSLAGTQANIAGIKARVRTPLSGTNFTGIAPGANPIRRNPLGFNYH